MGNGEIGTLQVQAQPKCGPDCGKKYVSKMKMLQPVYRGASTGMSLPKDIVDYIYMGEYSTCGMCGRFIDDVPPVSPNE